MKTLSALFVLGMLAFAASLAGCTYTNVQYGDASMTSWRFWTDTSASLETPDLRANYSSDADTAAAASQADRLLGLVEGLAMPVQLRAREP